MAASRRSTAGIDLGWRARAAAGFRSTADGRTNCTKGSHSPPGSARCHDGYNSFSQVQRDWAESGCHVLGFDVRGFGRSLAAVPDVSPHGWILTGVEWPQASVLRRRSLRLHASRRLRSATRRGPGRCDLAGRRPRGEFRRRLALMAEGHRPRADMLAVGVPTFGWFAGA